MPRIFDNIDQQLLPALRETLELSERADFCVGYFNLRGWKSINSAIQSWPGGEGHCYRLLVRMANLLQEELLNSLRGHKRDGETIPKKALRLKKVLGEELRPIRH